MNTPARTLAALVAATVLAPLLALAALAAVAGLYLLVEYVCAWFVA